MLSSRRNRGTRGVDDPWDDDGFYAHRRFKARRKTGGPSGKRPWRRTLRAKEKEEWRRDLTEDQTD